jgi:fatty acid desaturase
MNTFQSQEDCQEIINKIPQDFFQVNPLIYLTDFGFYTVLGWSCFIYLGKVDFFSIQFFILFIVSALSLYRSIGFVHEICHHPTHPFIKKFKIIWNLLIGIFFFFPSGFYDCHMDHHNPKRFKTQNDTQYIVVKGQPFIFLNYIVIPSITLPIFFMIRCLIVSPISFLNPSLRLTVENKFSSLGKPNYIANFNPKQRQFLRQTEVATVAVWSGIIALLLLGIIPINYLGLYYCLSSAILFLNFNRVIHEHFYDAFSETPLSMEEHFLDSYNYSEGFFIRILFVVGLQYHALHHLCPAIPYHNLPKAHRYLKKCLPENSLYHKAEKTFLQPF